MLGRNGHEIDRQRVTSQQADRCTHSTQRAASASACRRRSCAETLLHRHRRRADRAGQRPVGRPARRIRLRPAPAASPHASAMGTGEVVDIEREVELGGPIHSKGVLILAGFLAAHFAADAAAVAVCEPGLRAVLRGHRGRQRLRRPSCAPCCRRSAEVPIHQALAVTGSVNQHGRDPGHRRGQREDRGLLRHLQQARGLTGDPGRADSQRPTSST